MLTIYLGESGAGKTYCIRKEVKRYLMNMLAKR